MTTPEANPDCQMLGTVQDLFPPVLAAVKGFSATKPDAESRSVARGLNTEAALYGRLIAKILLLVDVPSVRDPSLHQKATAKLGKPRTDLLIRELIEMHRLLSNLIRDFGNTSRGTTILRQLQPDGSSVKANVPKSKMQRRVDKVSRANVQLSALLELQAPLPFPDMHHSPPSTTSWYHHDGEKPTEALKAIVAAFACSCSKSHIAGLRCACSQCNPGFTEPEPKSDHWDFEVALCRPDSPAAGPGDVEGNTPAEDLPTVPSSVEKPTWTSRISLDASPTASQGPGLCSFLNGDYELEQAVGSSPHIKSLKKSSRSFSSLHEVLQGRTPLLDTRKRMALAYHLCTAVLHFCNTPWADRLWTSEDWLVGLDRSGGFPVVFLNRHLGQEPTKPTKPTKTGGAWRVASREPILAQLGIALAELALGRSLSDVRRDDPEMMDKELVKMNDFNLLDLLTTRKILSLGYIALATSPVFEDVVSACVTQQYRDSYDAGVRELDTKEPTFLERAKTAILQPLYQEVATYLGHPPTNAFSRVETKRNPVSPVHKHAETTNWKQPAPAPAPKRRAKPAPSDTLRPSRRFSPPPPAASSGSEGVFVESLNNTAKTDTSRTDAAVGTKTSGTRGTPRPTEPTSSQQRSQRSSGLDTPASESADDDAGSMDIQNGEADAAEPPSVPSFAPSCGEDLSTWSLDDYSESEQSLDSAFQWLPSDEHFVGRLHPQHPLLALSDMALRTIIREFRISMAAGGAGGSTMPSRQPPSNYGAGSYAGSNAGGRKRPRGNNGKAPLRRTSDDGEDDDQFHQSPPPSRAGPSAEGEGPDLACPFFKKDSIAHQACYRFRLKRIRDVKQHVGRKHSMPIYCPICNDIFPREQERDDHVREKRCPENPFAKPEGTTEEQKKRLGKRAPANQTREEQWYGIFYTLFDATIARPTSPFLEIDGVLFHGAISLQRYIEGPGVQVLDTFLSESNAVSWNNTPYGGRPYTEEEAAAFRREILERALRAMFKNWQESTARPTASIPDSRPATSAPTQSSSDIYPVTPSSMASQPGTNYTTPNPMSQLPLRPFASSSIPPSFASHNPSTNPDMIPAAQTFGSQHPLTNPGLITAAQDFGNVVYSADLQHIFDMTALNLESGLINDVEFDDASLYTSTSASEAGQNMNYGQWNFQ